ncbi:MAG: hypothetical protein LZ171_05950 [Thaumarchaeota archaeon]|jgi:hypothetical protein|nr:hypothetical protein [Candidatus Geocrenenecus arthurdayi]MCL7391565.1 hypothetical protein [Candidatus Geocrenenecus arthurdayi]
MDIFITPIAENRAYKSLNILGYMLGWINKLVRDALENRVPFKRYRLLSLM